MNAGEQRGASRVDWEAWRLTVKNLVWPIFCKSCGRRLLTEENRWFCPTCWDLVPRIERPFCTVCGRPHRGAVGFGTQSNFPCAECRDHDKRPYGRVFGVARYDGVMEEAVKWFKFRDKPRLAEPISLLMAELARDEMDMEDYDCLVPVPLYPVRERYRGYNQSRLLAVELAAHFPETAVDESLKRIRPTAPQSGLPSAKERLRSVRGAFAVIDGDHLKGKRVLLVDDVVTTSGTITECARTLKRAGVARVDVLAAALTCRGLNAVTERTTAR